MSKYTIAIDGTAGSGKSTISKIIAKNNNLLFISSGMLYRVVGLYLKKDDTNQEIKLKLKNINFKCDKSKFYLDNIDVSEKIYENKTSLLASFFAKNLYVREFVNSKLKEMSKEYDVIIDGRDIGLNVLPNANLKFFLSTSLFQRTVRRKKELELKNEKILFIKLFMEILWRDISDKKRKIDPLIKCDGAIEISTTNKKIEDVVKIIEKYIKR